jgi:hypothetical protein
MFPPGCDPFATLYLSLAARFQALQGTLIKVSRKSTAIAHAKAFVFSKF